jgi:hypothetical protein
MDSPADQWEELRAAATAAQSYPRQMTLNPATILALLAERERLEKAVERAEADYDCADLRAALRKSEERAGRLVEALTPSAETKAAYIGEFGFNHPYGVDEEGADVSIHVAVPWTTIKEIMAAIRARATLTNEATDD